MISSGHAKHFYPENTPLLHSREQETKSAREAGEAIPPRYRKEWGGIDLEQVQRDQQAARRRVVQTMLRSLGGKLTGF